MPRRVEGYLRFRQLKVYRSAFRPERYPFLREFLHQFERRHDALVLRPQRLVAVEHRLHARISQARRRAYNALAHGIARAPAAAVEVDERGEHQPVLALVERAQPVGQALGQHRYDAVGKIDARSAQVRLAVERTVWRNVLRDVGDIHTQPIAVIRSDERHRVVKVLGVAAVNSKYYLVAEVAAVRRMRLLDVDLFAVAVGLVEHVVRELRAQVVRSDNAFDVHAYLVEPAEHRRDLRAVAALVDPANELYQYLVELARAAERRYLNALAVMPVVGQSVKNVVAESHRSNDVERIALDYLYDTPLAPPPIAHGAVADYDGANGIAVPRPDEIPAGNEHVAERVGDKAEPVAFAVQKPPHGRERVRLVPRRSAVSDARRSAVSDSGRSFAVTASALMFYVGFLFQLFHLGNIVLHTTRLPPNKKGLLQALDHLYQPLYMTNVTKNSIASTPSAMPSTMVIFFMTDSSDLDLSLE